MRLVHTPPAATNESLAGYFSRLKQINHYGDQEWLADLLDVRRLTTNLNITRSPADYKALAEFANKSITQIYELTVHRFAPYIFTPEQIEGFDAIADPEAGHPRNLPLLEIGIATTYSRARPLLAPVICPLCWIEKRVLLLPWSMRHVTACPEHQILLLDACSCCGARLEIEQPPYTCRKCSTPLHKLPTYSIATHDVSRFMSSIVWSSLGLGLTKDSDMVASINSKAGSPLSRMTTQTILKFIWRFAQIVAIRDPHNPIFAGPERAIFHESVDMTLKAGKIGSVKASHKLFTGACEMLMDWPATWYRTLDRLADIERTNTGFPRLSRILELEFNGLEWDWLTESWEEYVREDGFGHGVSPIWRYHTEKRSKITKIVAEQRPYLETSEPTKKYKVLRSLPLFALVPVQSNSKLVPGRDALEGQEWREREWRDLWTLEKVADFLGISQPHVSILAQSKILPFQQINKHTRRMFPRVSIERFLDAILGAVSTEALPADDDLLSFTKAIRVLRAKGLRLADILEAIVAGRLQAFRADKDGNQRLHGLHVLKFSSRVIDEYMNCERLPDGRVLLTKIEAYKRLNCSFESLEAWCKAGLIVPIIDTSTQGRMSPRFDEQELELFRTKYIGYQEAAEILGIAPDLVGAWVRKGWLVPEYRDSSAGYYLFKRAYIEHQRDDQISGEQASQILGVPISRIQDWARSGFIERVGHKIYSRRELLEWRENRINTREVASMIGVTTATIIRWVEAGRLTPANSTGKNDRWWWFSKSYIEEWQQERVTTEYVMEQLGIGRPTLFRLRKVGKLVDLDKGPGGRVWFRRADVEALLLQKGIESTQTERVTSEQAIQILGIGRTTFFRWKDAGILVPTGKGPSSTVWYRRADIETLRGKLRR